ncbi:hypothetical protein M427DRAFT_31888 [Gonapodya prolifera JEL478]|uniref:Uncharacterized protein n=1 Tax=Gonapodya prolifera (strain JEL478) TaxID=1344416 RepID=A0A139AGR7_GONPJ|nr:hypothetical protein M427DRAFT_31888 [Gonapodya prolifera JEL478]|eukprot:KXS15938.1 hypothetical protein M427DRAFT_31888 [Gonapodya prolifera JEL478]
MRARITPVFRGTTTESCATPWEIDIDHRRFHFWAFWCKTSEPTKEPPLVEGEIVLEDEKPADNGMTVKHATSMESPVIPAIRNHQLFVAEQNMMKMMKLVHEFPQLRTIAADAVSKASTNTARVPPPHKKLAASAEGIIPSELDDEGKPLITEVSQLTFAVNVGDYSVPNHQGQLRSFLIRDHQTTRPDAKRNPLMTSSVPVISRQRLSDNLGWVPGGRNARDKEGIKVRIAQAKEDAEYWTVRPSSATGWQGIVEERIEQARRAGQFDDIKSTTTAKMRLMYERALRPPPPPRPTSTSSWLFRSSSLPPPMPAPVLPSASPESIPATYTKRATPHATARVKEINDRIRSYNMYIPRGIPQKIPLVVKMEVERGAGLHKTEKADIRIMGYNGIAFST